MSDFRTNKSVGQRVDLEFNRRQNPLLRQRRAVTWSVFFLSLVAVAVLLAQNDKTVYWGGELSSSHKLFENDCRQCHDQRFQPAVRLAKLDTAVHSVSDAACRNCHQDFHSRDHNRYITDQDAQLVHNCAICHVEHQGDTLLSWVSDAHCVNCHDNLQVDADHANFVARITSLSDHPDFALHRPPSDSTGSEHLVNQLASAGDENQWSDQSRIKFDHHYHLDPAGLPVPPTHPEYVDDGEYRKVLACADCHEADAAGQYMQPINYEKHCADCHRLEFRSELALAADGASLPLPHDNPTIIRGILRDRLMTYAENHPTKLGLAADNDSGDSPPDLPRHPNKTRNEPPTAEDKWTWVESMLKQMEQAIALRTSGHRDIPNDESVLPKSPDDMIGHVQTGCAHCHFIERPTAIVGNNELLSSWRIVPTKIPTRWLPHSRFDHSKHRDVADIFLGPYTNASDGARATDDRSCVICHEPNFSDSGTGEETQWRLTSESASDILMPSIKVCQACHTSNEAGTRRMSGHARDNCVECHGYHHPVEGHPPIPTLLDKGDAD